MRFDLSKIERREWRHDDEEWRLGVVLDPNGVSFWGESHDGDEGGAFGMTFAEFLRAKDFRSTPKEITDEIREILLAAKIKPSKD